MATRIRSVGVWTWTRLSIACFAGALLLTLGMFFWAGYGLDSPGAVAFALGIRAAVVIALAALTVAGVITAVLAVAASLRNDSVPPLVFDGLVVAGTLRRRRRVALAAIFAAVNLGVIAVGTLHILVWNPLAKVPGLELGELYEQMYAVGEGIGSVPFVASWAVFWGIATLAYVVACALHRLQRFFGARRIAAVGLVLLGATSGFHWFAGFTMGMSLADAFGTSGGDAAWTGPLVAVTGQLALVAALFVALVPRRSATPPAQVSATVAPAPA